MKFRIEDIIVAGPVEKVDRLIGEAFGEIVCYNFRTIAAVHVANAYANVEGRT